MELFPIEKEGRKRKENGKEGDVILLFHWKLRGDLWKLDERLQRFGEALPIIVGGHAVRR